MEQTKKVWDGEKFTEISNAQMPEFIVALRGRVDQRAKVYDRITLVQFYAFFVVPLLVLFIWFVAHWFAVSDGWIAFGRNYIFCVLPICVTFLYVAKEWHDATPHLPE